MPTLTPLAQAVRPPNPPGFSSIADDPLYKSMEQVGENAINTQYGQAQTGMETSMVARGLGRSGFAMQAEGQLNAGRMASIGSMQSDVTNKVMGYRQQEEELQLQQANQARQNSSWFSSILGVVGSVAGSFLCPGIGTMAGGMLGRLAGGGTQ
jgi:hypothetical protein